jgi:hypothetical protein
MIYFSLCVFAYTHMHKHIYIQPTNFFLSGSGTGVWAQSLTLLGRCCTTWTTLPAHQIFTKSFDGGFYLLYWWFLFTLQSNISLMNVLFEKAIRLYLKELTRMCKKLHTILKVHYRFIVVLVISHRYKIVKK